MRRLNPEAATPSYDAWATTRPSPLSGAGARAQPPLREVMHGLDARELEGQTVFDQYFGALREPPAGRPRRPM